MQNSWQKGTLNVHRNDVEDRIKSLSITILNQKPLYKTRFMLDELGNLQSEGHGISNLETMLSIGLGCPALYTCNVCIL